MDVLFLITARGGSKGIPGKNLKEIAGTSLIGFKAISARRSKYCSRLVISTDSVEIQENARSYGVEVPFTRPPDLATDTANSSQVISHTIEWFEGRGDRYDAIMLLEPTSPFARSLDYDNSIELMAARGASAVVGVRPVEASSIYIRYLDDHLRLRHDIDKAREARKGTRQSLRQECRPNGALYLFGWDYFKEYRNIYHDQESVLGYMMDPMFSVEIDDLIDLYWAEFLIERNLLPLSEWQ